MKSKEKLKNSEWILIILVIVLLLTIIFIFVTYYGSNKDIVSYVGFAGTIVSIILAVLAIVYTYYQNVSQEQSSYRISEQIIKLSTVASKLNEIDEIAVNLRQTLAGIETLKGQVMSLQIMQQKNQSIITPEQKKFKSENIPDKEVAITAPETNTDSNNENNNG